MTSQMTQEILLPNETWNAELAARPKAAIDWVWPGYLAHGAVTLLTSQAKTGKTTLISVLLAKMARGGELSGRAVQPARVAVVSEESLDYWQRRGENLHFGDELCFLCRPFTSPPSMAAWEVLLERLAELGRQRRIDVVILDPLAPLLPPGAESHTSLMIQALMGLTRLTRQGQAVLVLHHPTKGAVTAGQLARGCSALGASVDIQMEMSLIGSALETDRRRRIAAWSRFEETPRRLMVELSDDGREYRAIPETEQEDSFARQWPVVERLLAFPPRKLSRQELLIAWRAKATAPSPMTLWRVLDRAVEAGLLLCEGAGTCLDPFRYWLAVLPTEWETRYDPAADYWPLVEHLLSHPPRKLSQPQLLHKWPKAGGLPNPALLDRCLKRAVSEGRVLQEGSGRRGEPVHYFIDGLDAAYEPDFTDLLTF
jgi:hypothetical protein